MFASVSKYGLEDDTVDFIGHALALHRDDNYLDEPAIHTVKRMKVLHISTFNLHIIALFELFVRAETENITGRRWIMKSKS